MLSEIGGGEVVGEEVEGRYRGMSECRNNINERD